MIRRICPLLLALLLAVSASGQEPTDNEADDGTDYQRYDLVRDTNEFTKQFNHLNLFFGPQVSIPLSENNEYATREGVLAAGAGRVTAGFSVTATGIMDPIVWNLGLRYDAGLPKQERFYTLWLPGIIQLSASLSDLVNERFGFAVGTYQQLELPAIKNGVPDKGGPSVASFFTSKNSRHGA